jgi:hypothetical protein
MANVLDTKPELLREFCGRLIAPGDETVVLYADGRAVEMPVFDRSGQGVRRQPLLVPESLRSETATQKPACAGCIGLRSRPKSPTFVEHSNSRRPQLPTLGPFHGQP